MSGVMVYTKGDAQLLRPLAARWEKEAGNSFGLEMDIDSHLADLQAMIDSPASDVLLLIADDHVAGYMGVQVFRSPVGRELIANEHYWYVAKEKRGAGSLRMIDAAIAWAKAHGASKMLFNASHLASDAHDSVCKLYERRGMKPFETTFITEV